MIHKDSMGYWSAPNNLGPAINTAGDEKSPFIHTDDLTLYFSSTGHPNLGGFDIFYSKKDTLGSWQKPVNIGYPINSESDDLGFFVSTDGATGFFASNKGKGGPGGWDIYSFPLYEGARPEKVILMKGKVLDEKGKVVSDAKIDVKDLKTNEITHIDVDSSGEYVFAKALRNDQMVMVTKEGYFYSSETFKKEDKKSTGVTNMNFSIESLHKGGTYKIKNLFFSNKSSALNDLATAELTNLLHFMNDNADLHIEVQGHTDNVGNDNDNLLLSQSRAKAVHEFLINNGVDASRVRFRGYGETKPVASNDTEDGRAKNRRTEIVIL
jgi:outer membrane protein OmpA-like peptidoglycan-associated protein